MSGFSADSKPIDFERINDATGGDEEFLAELVDIFLEDAALRVDEIHGAVASGDATELRRTAHKLKGSSANVGANGLMSLAKELEDIGCAGNVGPAQTYLEGLNHELARVKGALVELVADGAA